MGFLSKIFGSSEPKEQTIEDYMKSNQVPVIFKKLYYTYPTNVVNNENVKMDYTSYEDFIKDYPELRFHQYKLENCKNITITSGFFFHFRGYYYNCKSIEACLSKLIGFYMKDDWYSQPKDKCMLATKNYFDKRFSKSNCFLVEVGDNIQMKFFKVNNKIILTDEGYHSNKYSTLSIGDVNNKPILLGDKVPLINLEGECREFFGYKNDDKLYTEMKSKNVPDFFNVYYGYIINHQTSGMVTGVPVLEPLLRRKDVVVDFLKHDEIDFDKYLESFTKQSRKQKLEKLMRINNEI